MDKTQNLLNLLREQPSFAVPLSDSNKKKFRSSKGGTKNFSHLVIGPSRAIITFNKDRRLFKSIKRGIFKASKVAMPDNWTNFDSKVSKYADYVSKPQNQQKCGSCFAFAVASTINDVFIFGKNLNFNPDISPLSILSCVKDNTCNLQCDGGDPLGVLDWIQSKGVTTNYCMNYTDSCNSISSCYQPNKKPFDEAKKEKTFKSSNKPIKIPPCGCCGDGPNFSYYVNQPHLISTTTGINIEGNEDAVQIIKEHLYAFGAAVSGYVVYSNFVKDKSNGKFEKTSGIYIESENYCPDSVIVDGKVSKVDPYEFMGCHAISIVGWGVEKNPIKLDDGTVLKETPYWYCRNSWSKDWGLNGYFKMAMYQKVGKKEINKTTAFERINSVSIPNIDPKTKESKTDTYQMGGTIVFTPKKFVEYDKKRDPCDNKSKSYDEPSPKDNKESKKLDSPVNTSPGTSSNGSSSTNGTSSNGSVTSNGSGSSNGSSSTNGSGSSNGSSSTNGSGSSKPYSGTKNTIIIISFVGFVLFFLLIAFLYKKNKK